MERAYGALLGSASSSGADSSTAYGTTGLGSNSPRKAATSRGSLFGTKPGNPTFVTPLASPIAGPIAGVNTLFAIAGEEEEDGAPLSTPVTTMSRMPIFAPIRSRTRSMGEATEEEEHDGSSDFDDDDHDEVSDEEGNGRGNGGGIGVEHIP